MNVPENDTNVAAAKGAEPKVAADQETESKPEEEKTAQPNQEQPAETQSEAVQSKPEEDKKGDAEKPSETEKEAVDASNSQAVKNEISEQGKPEPETVKTEEAGANANDNDADPTESSQIPTPTASLRGGMKARRGRGGRGAMKRGGGSGRGRGGMRGSKLAKSEQDLKHAETKSSKSRRGRGGGKAGRSKGSSLSKLMDDANALETSTASPPKSQPLADTTAASATSTAAASAPTTKPTAPTQKQAKEKKEKAKDTKKAAPPKKSSGGLWGWITGGPKQPSYTAGQKEEYVDPKTGEKKMRTNINIEQYAQVKPVFNEETGKYEFRDAKGNLIDDGDDGEESSDDELPPTMRGRARKPPAKAKASNSEEKVSSEEKDIKKLSPAPTQQQPVRATPATTAPLNAAETNDLRREIMKLKRENAMLRQQLAPSAKLKSNADDMKYDSSANLDELDVMQRRVLDRLDQNHRILRYLHNWADNLPQMLNTSIPAHLVEFNKQNGFGSAAGSSSSFSIFGVSILHIILLVLLLTLGLVFWDSQSIEHNDMDIVNSMIQFMSDLYVVCHGYIPPSLHQYETVVVEFAEIAMNKTTVLTQHLMDSIR